MKKYYFIYYRYSFNFTNPDDGSSEHHEYSDNGLFQTSKREMKNKIKTMVEIKLSDIDYFNLDIEIDDYNEVRFNKFH